MSIYFIIRLTRLNSFELFSQTDLGVLHLLKVLLLLYYYLLLLIFITYLLLV